MAFPNTPVIETFTAADGTLVASLANWADLGGASIANILSNAATTVGGGGSYCGAFIDTATYGPDCEAYVTCTEAGAYFGVIARGSDLAGTPDGYKAGWNSDAGGTITLENMTTSTVLDSLSSGSGTPSVGDKLGIQCVGSTIRVFIDAGSGWTQMISEVDTAHSGAGNIGFDMFDSGGIAVDDFGGGTFVEYGQVDDPDYSKFPHYKLRTDGNFPLGY